MELTKESVCAIFYMPHVRKRNIHMAQKFEYNVNKSTWSMTHLLLEPGIPGIFKVTDMQVES